MYLMHKDIVVADISLFNNVPITVNKIYQKDELPVGLIGDEDFASCNITEWHSKRVIPAGRVDLSSICQKLNSTADELSIRSLGLSLTDAYWYKPVDSNLTWKDVNFYDNGFIPDLLLLDNGELKEIHRSPDYTTNGCLKKFWICQNGQAFLIKSGGFDEQTYLLAANEVVAYKIANRLKIDAVPYEQTMIGERKYCVCPSFIKSDSEEFVPLSAIEMQLETHGDNFLIRRFLQEQGLKAYLDQLGTLDILLHNYDRHLDNAGLIRDTETKEYLRACPIFDTGSCLNWNGCANEACNMAPFESDMYDYASSIDLPEEIPPLEELTAIIREVYAEYDISEHQTERAVTELTTGYQIISEKILEQAIPEPDIDIAD